MPKKKNTADAPAARRAPRGRAAAATVRRASADARPKPTYNEIAEAAYHRYLNRQGAHGSDFDDWLEAERELRSRASNPKS
jgi:hypothetical protein